MTIWQFHKCFFFCFFSIIWQCELLKSNPLIKFGKFVIIVLLVWDYEFVVESVHCGWTVWSHLKIIFTAIWWNFIVNFIRNHVGCVRCRQIQVGFLLSWAHFLHVLLQMQSKYSTSFHFHLYAHIKWERKKCQDHLLLTISKLTTKKRSSNHDSRRANAKRTSFAWNISSLVRVFSVCYFHSEHTHIIVLDSVKASAWV